MTLNEAENEKSLSIIKETYDYQRFSSNKKLKNNNRVKYLAWRKLNYCENLPLVEVRRLGDKLKIVGDVDSYYAAVMTKSSVCYYETFTDKINTHRRSLQLSEDEVASMVSTMNLYEALLSEEKN